MKEHNLKNIKTYIHRLMNDTTNDKPIWNMEKILSGKANHWNYVDGCMLDGFMRLYKETNDETYYNFLKNYVDFYLEETTPKGYKFDAFNLDNINEGKVLFDLYEKTNDKKYFETMELLYKQLQNQPRTKEGNFWHKKIYPNQIWLDGLYMAIPFYTKYETKYNKLANYKDIFTQITNVRSLMFDETKKLYYHGYDSSKSIFWADKKTGLSQNHWLRSIGWFAASLVDTLDEMDESMFYEYRTIQSIYKELVDGMIPYLSSEKMWYQVVNKQNAKGNYLETSGSLMLAYSMLKAVRLYLLPTKYRKIAEDIYFATVEKYLQNIDGKLQLGGVCLVAGLGPENNTRRDGTTDYYFSEKIVNDDGKGTAPLLFGYIEILKIRKEEYNED